ncbi:hypothetical protein [Peribacillus frigoritolerans]
MTALVNLGAHLFHFYSNTPKAEIPNQLLLIDSTTIIVEKQLPWTVYHGE